VAEGTLWRYEDLAGALNADQHLIEQMLEHLGRMGYLSPIGQECVQTCNACPLVVECRAAVGGRVWVLTERGARRAQEGHLVGGTGKVHEMSWEVD
jgi:hypothetical protein